MDTNLVSSVRKCKFKILLCLLFLGLFSEVGAQKRTEDLSFLLGKWNVERIYYPETENPNIMNGTMECELAGNNAFIKCEYEMERLDRPNATDIVYYNYNKIYHKYESLWLSSTWPIKVLLQGDLTTADNGTLLNTTASFLIENGITEYVMDKLLLTKDDPKIFVRKTYVRTSVDENEKFTYHMLEKTRRVD